MASDLKFLINTRKYVRKLVTQCHNQKHTFSSLTTPQREREKNKIEDYLEQLKKLNSDIQKLRWSEEDEEAWLEEELSKCEEYFDKIRECSALLKENATPSSASVDTARSLLKSPTAPLPVFKSNEGEDLLKFFKNFESITSMFQYSEYDSNYLLNNSSLKTSKSIRTYYSP